MNWIKIKEKKPELLKEVLLWEDGRRALGCLTTIYCRRHWRIHESLFVPLHNFTYWAEIEAPKEEL